MGVAIMIKLLREWPASMYVGLVIWVVQRLFMSWEQ